MLIQLDETLLESIGAFTSQEWDALNNLAVAARESKHYLICPKILAGRLSRESNIGSREQGLYQILDRRYSTIAGMARSVNISIRVTKDLVMEKAVNGSSVEIRVPLSFFSSTTSIQPAIILCENLDDCELMAEMAMMYAKSERLSGIKIKLDRRPGGGSTIAPAAESILNEGDRLLLTFVDSDRKTPEGPLGRTASDAKRKFDELQPLLAKLVILEAKDLENLLPDEFFRTAMEKHFDHARSATFLGALIDAGCHHSRLHIDIKEGLKLNQLWSSDYLACPDYDLVWGKLIERIIANGVPVKEQCINCAVSGRCAKPQACDCVLTCGNDLRLLKIGSEAWRRYGRDFWNSMPEGLLRIVRDVSRETFEWGCAGSFQPG